MMSSINSNGLRRAAAACTAFVLVAALLPPGVGAAPPGGNGNGEGGASPLILEIRPGGGPKRTGELQSVEVQVSRPNGEGADGVDVDFEITEGPADDDVGGGGFTPQSPDLSCTTAGGERRRPATCTVTYREADNEGGSDAVLAWVDEDGVDATVEADLEEGENQHAPGPGGCRADSKGPGTGPEPDGTDCAEKRWIARVPDSIDLAPETASAVLPASGSVEATVLDQFGEPFTATGTTVQFELLAGSAHDPGDGSDPAAPDLGSCNTGTSGRCSVALPASAAGVDAICGYFGDGWTECSEGRDAAERDDRADVVERVWEAPPATVVGGGGTATPPAQPTPEPDTKPKPKPKPKPEKQSPDRRDDDRVGDRPEPEPRPDAPRSDTLGDTRAAPAPRRTRTAKAKRPRGAKARERKPASRRQPTRRRTTAERSGAAAAPARRVVRSRPRSRPERGVEDAIRQLSKAAVSTADRFSFPLSLMLLVVIFLALQGRLDARDPKLRLAPVDSHHDLMDFA